MTYPETCKKPCRAVTLFAIMLTATVLSLISANMAEALNTSVQIAAGYDDNITLSAEPVSSGFTCYGAGVSHQFLPETPQISLEGFGSADYMAYFSASDNFGIDAGFFMGFPLKGGRFTPGVLYKAILYRDREQPEDEMNAHYVQGVIEWLPTSRLVLGIWQSFEWDDYQNPVNIHSGAGLPQNGKKRGETPPQAFRYTAGESVDRDDTLRSSGTRIAFFFSPALEVSGAFSYNSLSSDIAEEAYRETDLSCSIIWTPVDVWKISAETEWRETRYCEILTEGERRDRGVNFGMGISRFVGSYELFLNFYRQDNDSTITGESYNGKVMQCGISLSF